MQTTTADSIAATALAYAQAGRCVFPVAPGTKWPSLPLPQAQVHDIAWRRDYGDAPPDHEQIMTWFASAPVLGISIAMGAMSGAWHAGIEYALELIDVDDAASWEAYRECCAFSGFSALIERLVIERTPRGGGHLGYLCASIEGNQKLAQALDPITSKPMTLIETRGTGGQAVVAPTPVGVHPDMPEHAYTAVQGAWTDPPIITPQERQALLDLARSLNTYVATPFIVSTPPLTGAFASQPGSRPGDKLNASADDDWWRALLEKHAWTLLRSRGGIQYWQRPGKQGQGCSATLGACGPYFYVFSSNADPFEPEHAYKPFSAYTLLDHGGDFETAAQALAEEYRTTVFIEQAEALLNVPEPPVASNGATPVGWQPTPPPKATVSPSHVAMEIPGLLTKKNGEPYENLSNITLILRHHPYWQGRLWWDAVRGLVMVDDARLNDRLVIDIAVWFATHTQMGIKSTTLLEKCLVAVAQDFPRDLLQHWLNGLQPWDGTPRLATWLCDYAGTEHTSYSTDVGQVLLFSMLARAAEPGCIARFVVIFEGDENSGKSSLVRALAGDDWYIELQSGLDTKEAHMLIQGKWVAELAELDPLSITREESRLKAFITTRQDSWIPKYSNNRIEVLRRCIFIGTTNRDGQQSLRGQSGNTRFLPIRTGIIDLEGFTAVRSQLFAEALSCYQQRWNSWWILSPEGEEQAKEERDARRIASVYEDDLSEWLEMTRFNMWHLPNSRLTQEPEKDITSWREIAQGFLAIDEERWADIRLQKEIATALHALGWERLTRKRPKTQHAERVWRKTIIPF